VTVLYVPHLLDSGLTLALCLKRRPPHSGEGGSGRALPTETNVESGTSQSKSGTSVNLSNSGELAVTVLCVPRLLDSGLTLAFGNGRRALNLLTL